MLSLQDRFEIHELYARQSHAVDGSDGDGWADTFTEDGVFESPTYKLVARGREELREFAISSNEAARSRGEQLRHVISAIVIDDESEGRVTARAYLVILATDAERSRIDRSLVLEDELRSEQGVWKFSHRKTLRDPQTQPSHR